MRALGLTYVRIGEFAWGRVEKSEGDFKAAEEMAADPAMREFAESEKTEIRARLSESSRATISSVWTPPPAIASTAFRTR